MRSNRQEDDDKWTSDMEDWKRARHQKRRVHHLLAEQGRQRRLPPRSGTNIRGHVSSGEVGF